MCNSLFCQTSIIVNNGQVSISQSFISVDERERKTIDDEMSYRVIKLQLSREPSASHMNIEVDVCPLEGAGE